jgi:hypothetical protein
MTELIPLSTAFTEKSIRAQLLTRNSQCTKTVTDMHKRIQLIPTLKLIISFHTLLPYSFKIHNEITLFGVRLEDVIRQWRKLHSEELRDLYFAPGLFWCSNPGSYNGCSMWQEWEMCIQDLGGKSTGKGPLARHRYRLDDKINIDLNGKGRENKNCINMAQDRISSSC